MTQKQKLLEQFLQNPSSVSYKNIKTLLVFLGFIHVSAKGSHEKWKHALLEKDIIVPVHNNECKDFYKKDIAQKLQNIF